VLLPYAAISPEPDRVSAVVVNGVRYHVVFVAVVMVAELVSALVRARIAEAVA
jgi:hypothetical protein